MIVSREREKMLNAIVFFSKETKRCHTMKLFKLLNFLDFEHYRQAGRTVTGLHYAAFEKGPVPPDLWAEIRDGPKADFAALVSVRDAKDDQTGAMLRRDIKAKKQFDASLFTKRELSIMKLLAEIFDEANGDTMSDFSHMKGLPWKVVWAGGKGKGKPIREDLALKSESIDRDAPTIEADELALRRDLRRELA